MYNKMYEAYVITHSCIAVHVLDMLWSWGEVICVMITAVAVDVTFLQVFSIVEKRWRQKIDLVND